MRWDDPAVGIEWPIEPRGDFGQGRQVAGLRSRLPRRRDDAGPDMKVLLTGRQLVHRLLVRATRSAPRARTSSRRCAAPPRAIRRACAPNACAGCNDGSGDRRSGAVRLGPLSRSRRSRAASTCCAITRRGSATTAAPTSTSPARSGREHRQPARGSRSHGAQGGSRASCSPAACSSRTRAPARRRSSRSRPTGCRRA